MTSRTVLPVVAVGGLAALSMAVPAASVGVTSASTAAHVSSVHPVPDVVGPILKAGQFPAPQTIAQCQADFGINCYTPLQYRVAYDLNPLYDGQALGRDITGKGPDHRDRGLVRLAHHPGRSAHLRSAVRLPQPRPADYSVRDHPAVRLD